MFSKMLFGIFALNLCGGLGFTATGTKTKGKCRASNT